MKSWKSIALGILIVSVAAGPVQAQTKLRYKLKEGDKLDYLMDQKMKMSMSLGGKDVDIKINQQMDMTWNVASVDAQGNAKVKMKIGRMKMTMNGPTGNVDIDSNDKKEPDDQVGMILFQVVNAIAGMEMDFTLSPSGKMTDTKIPEAVMKKLKNLPGADQGIGNMLSEDNLKNMVHGNLTFPEDAVEKGATWDQKHEVKLPFGKMAGKMKYTYQGEETKNSKTLEKIGYKTKFTLEPDPKAPVQISLKGQDGQGRILFDNKNGRLMENSLEQTMQMSIDIGGMAINQSITQETRVKLKDAK